MIKISGGQLKLWAMNTAEVIDAYRIVPRALVAGYAYLVWDTVNWFMTLPDPSSQHTFLISTVVGGAAAVFGLYVNSGRPWEYKSTRRELYIDTGGSRSQSSSGPSEDYRQGNNQHHQYGNQYGPYQTGGYQNNNGVGNIGGANSPRKQPRQERADAPPPMSTTEKQELELETPPDDWEQN